ncbi:hypothetical protein F5X68DRAFT_262788, partial [Plectosphaerella plurivora]
MVFTATAPGLSPTLTATFSSGSSRMLNKASSSPSASRTARATPGLLATATSRSRTRPPTGASTASRPPRPSSACARPFTSAAPTSRPPTTPAPTPSGTEPSSGPRSASAPTPRRRSISLQASGKGQSMNGGDTSFSREELVGKCHLTGPRRLAIRVRNEDIPVNGKLSRSTLLPGVSATAGLEKTQFCSVLALNGGQCVR